LHPLPPRSGVLSDDDFCYSQPSSLF